MAIAADHIVSVQARLLEPAGVDLEFNGLLLTKSGLIPTGSSLVQPFGDAASVADYFGAESDEYAFAVIYFSGYVGAFRRPRALYICRRLDEPAAPFIRGGTVGVTLAQLKAITDGSLTLTLGTHSGTVIDLDFSEIASYSDAAELIQGAIRAHEEGGDDWTGATVTYSSHTRSFTITGGAAGADLIADYAGGTLAEPLSLTRSFGAVLSDGADAMTETEQMAAVEEVTRNWVTFTTLWLATRDEMLSFAQWATSKGVEYLYCPWDDDAALLDATNTTTSAFMLREANVGATSMWWGSVDYAAFCMAVAASIDWDRRDGAITFAFKSQDGLAPSVSKLADARALEAQGVNYIGNFATRNDQFILSYQGESFGTWRWIDTYINGIWLFSALQVAAMAGFKQTPRVPYTDAGYARVRAWLQDPINRALNNGVITPGMTLSESQKSQVNAEAGVNISNNLQADGFYLQVADPPPATRVTRGTPICNLWYTDAGSIHKLDITATALT